MDLYLGGNTYKGSFKEQDPIDLILEFNILASYGSGDKRERES